MSARNSIAERSGDDDVSEGLVCEELAWRRPAALAMPDAVPSRILASRWTDSTFDARRVIARIDADYYTIGVALKGTRVEFRSSDCGSYEGLIRPGTVQLAGRDQSLQAVFHSPCDFLHLHIGNHFLSECLDEAGGCESGREVRLVDPFFRHDSTIEQLARALLTADAVAGSFARLYADSIGVAIVTRLLDAYSNCASPVSRTKTSALVRWRLNRATEYIEAHLGDAITLADIANATRLSRMHFAAQFKAATGLRPHEYVLRRRVERAKELLCRSNLTLVDVALSVGFQTQAHFTTVFRRFVGDTPSMWRRINEEALASTQTTSALQR
jgi:AraC family transcriptional regulator